MQAVSPLLLLLLGLWARSQPGARSQAGADRQCPGSSECRKQEQCPAFTRQSEELKRLVRGSVEREALLERLKGEVCERESRRVCCEPVSREISGGNGYTDPHEFPFMVRITVTVNTEWDDIEMLGLDKNMSLYFSSFYNSTYYIHVNCYHPSGCSCLVRLFKTNYLVIRL